MKNAKINQDLQKLGITGDYELIYNPSYETLYQDEISPENQGFEKAVAENVAKLYAGEILL